MVLEVFFALFIFSFVMTTSFTQWLAKEKSLEKTHGKNIIFQVYRDNSTDTNIKLTGEDTKHKKETQTKSDERKCEISIIIPGTTVTGTDTVGDVKVKLKEMLGSSGFSVLSDEEISLFCNDIQMDDSDLFYADHYLLLPCWIQVILGKVKHQAK